MNSYKKVSTYLNENLFQIGKDFIIHSIDKLSVSDKTKQMLKDPFVLGSVVGFVVLLCILFIITFIYSIISRISADKIDKELTLKIRQLVPGKKWVVRIIDLSEAGPNKIKEYNAFTFTINNDIFITKDLYDDFPFEEQVAICLHEAAHTLGRHSVYGIVERSFCFSLIASCIKTVDDSQFFKDIDANLLTIGCLLFYLFSDLVLFNFVSRRLEWISDDYAIEKGYGKHLASAFNRMVKYYKIKNKNKTFWQKVYNWLEEFFSDHPDIFKRIENAFEKSSKYSEDKNEFIASVINNLKQKQPQEKF